jgi:RHS repeat-associated protein
MIISINMKSILFRWVILIPWLILVQVFLCSHAFAYEWWNPPPVPKPAAPVPKHPFSDLEEIPLGLAPYRLVNTSNGNFFIKETDLGLWIRGGTLDLSRTYNSKSDEDGVFGPGWSWSYGTRLIETKSGIIEIYEPDGYITRYTKEELDGKGERATDVLVEHIIETVRKEDIVKDEVKPEADYYLMRTRLINDPVYFEEILSRYNPPSAKPIPVGSYITSDRGLSQLEKHYDKYIRIKRDGSREEFDRQGKLVSQIDPNGNTITITYDEQFPLTICDDTDRCLKIVCGLDGLISHVVDSAGRQIDYTYDRLGSLVSVSDTSGNRSAYRYNKLGNMVFVKRAGGGFIKIRYQEEWDRVLEIEDAKGNVTSFSYAFDQDDPSEYTTTVTDALGQTTYYSFSPGSDPSPLPGELKTQIIKIRFPDGSEFMEENCEGCGQPVRQINRSGKLTTFEYDEDRRLVSIVDPLNRKYTIDYDGYSPSKITLPGNRKYNLVHDGKGNIVKVSTPEEVNTEYEYNKFGQIIAAIGPEGTKTSLEYNEDGQLVSFVDPLNNRIDFNYDQAGRVAGITLPDGSSYELKYNGRDKLTKLTVKDNVGLFQADENFLYNSEGQLVTISSPTGKVSYQYNSLGLINNISASEQRETAYEYDALGRVIQIQDPSGGIIQYEYDSFGRIINVIDQNGEITRYGYDKEGNVESIIDPIGLRTDYSYDAIGRLTGIKWPSGEVESFSYNEASRLAKRITHKGVVKYTYEGSKVQARYLDGKVATVVFDKSGRPGELINGQSHLLIAYDPLGRISSTKDAAIDRTLNYTYTSLGQVESLTLDSEKLANYTYDTIGRITQVLLDNEKSIDFIREGFGQEDRLLPNGLVYNYVLDPLVGIKKSNLKTMQGKVLKTLYYTYDKKGNLTAISDSEESASYEYDSAGRLVGWFGTKESKRYNYDGAGNLKYIQKRESGTKVQYTRAGQLNKVGTTAYTIDSHGNIAGKLTKEGKVLYKYDFENRLVGVRKFRKGQSRPYSRVRYSYDLLGRRIKKDIDGTVTKYLYDGFKVIAEIDGQGQFISKYYYNPTNVEPLALKKDNKYYYYRTNSIGAPIELYDKNQDKVWSAWYSPYGEISVEVEKIQNPLRFPGQYEDIETGLYYNIHRYYDPSLGRYLTPDPLGQLPDINRYRYVFNNPVMFMDPLGLWYFGFGESLSGGMMGTGLIISSGYVFGYSKEHGFQFGSYTTPGFGNRTGRSISLGLDFFFSENDDINSLNGRSTTSGASASLLGIVNAGFDIVIPDNGLKPIYIGSLGLGLGSQKETHVYTTYTNVYDYRKLLNWLIKVIC